jgi:hypothetical protein
MRRTTRRRILTIAIGAVSALVIALLVLIAVGYLVLPSTPSKKVTITGVEWTVVQGTTTGGLGWFGPSQFNYSGADGYPVNVTVGGTITIPWSFSTYDTVNHTIYSVVAGSPFAFVQSRPGIPTVIPGGSDDVFLEFVVRAPDTGGFSGELSLTVNVR